VLRSLVVRRDNAITEQSPIAKAATERRRPEGERERPREMESFEDNEG